MSSRAGLAVFAAVGMVVGCATPPPLVVPPVENIVAPVVRAEPTPLIESPPIELAAASGAAAPEPDAGITQAVPEPVLEPARTPAPTEPTEEQQLASVLADLQRYSALNGDELRRELNAVTQLLSRQRTDYNRIRLAVLYTLAKTTPQDDQRAWQLLDNVAKSNLGAPGAKQLAAVVQVQVTERIRAVREEQQKAEAAIKKLEALRMMERDLLRDRIRSGGGGAGGGSSGGGGGGGGGG